MSGGKEGTLVAPQADAELTTTKDGLRVPSKLSKVARPGRNVRGSVVTRLILNLQRESMDLSSWPTGILYLSENPGIERVRELMVERMLPMPRFRSRLIVSGILGKAGFKELPLEEIDMHHHVEEVLNDGPKTEEDIRNYLSHLYDEWEPDLSKPLWKVDLIPNFNNGGACLITRISHAIGDGVSQIEVLLRMLDPDSLEGDGEAAARPPAKRRPKPYFGPVNRALIFLGGVRKGLTGISKTPDKGNSMRTKKSSDISRQRRYAFSEKIALDEIKEVKNLLEDATVNDILVVILTLTLRKYFQGKGENNVLHGRAVNAQFPLSVRGRKEHAFKKLPSGELDPHNKWAYGFQRFYVSDKHNKDVLKLFWKIKRDLDIVKLSPQPVVTVLAAKFLLMPFLPLKGINGISMLLANKSTGQLSNVAAPPVKVRIGGATVEDMSFLLFSPLSSYFGIMSYNGSVSCTIQLEKNLNVNPEDIAKHWKPAFDEFKTLVISKASNNVIKRPRSFLDAL